MSITPTEWAALIGVGGTLLSGTVAALVTYKVTARTVTSSESQGEKQRVHDANERKADRDHEKSLAEVDRRQQRIRDAYVTIQVYISAWGRYAQWRSRTFTTEPPEPEPTLPATSAEAEAVASLLASKSVVTALEVVERKLILFRIALGDLDYWENMRSPDLPDSAKEFADSTNRMTTAANVLMDSIDSAHALMRDELGGSEAA